ncbi:cation:proton antiporter [Legionella lytica]|uniref:Cation:proton antiporter n=1 Tax=Legionella lytica TaxID=96232 RepID=A0ABW8D8X8_9GAMM
MKYYDTLIFIFGAAFLASAWLPSKLKKAPLSLPMIWLMVGIFVSMLDTKLPNVNPLKNSQLTERLTELALIISLLGAGLKLDRPLGWSNWNVTWRLLGITLPLSIGFMTLLLMYLLDLPFIVSFLLGALIAPTDPVLASDVQVGPPGKGNEHDVRFALTSEDGLNDGLAFPFVQLALVLTVIPITNQTIIHWMLWNMLWKISAGVIAGIGIGYLTAKIILKPTTVIGPQDGFIAVALTFLAYGSAQLINGYGFLGVFVAAHVFRHYDHDHLLHNTLYNFTEQLERLIIPLLLVIMSVLIYQGLFKQITRNEIIASLIFLLLIRPVTGLIGLITSKIPFYHRVIISVFGIRGIGSFYYLAYALNQTNYFLKYGQQLWRMTIFIVLVSIVFHGMSASLIFQRLTSSSK